MPELDDSQRSRMASRAFEAERMLEDLKAELEELTTLFQAKRHQALLLRLASENDVLRQQVAQHKNELLKLEIEHKVPQIAKPPFPREAGSTIEVVSQPQVVAAVQPSESPKPNTTSKTTKVSKGGETKTKAASGGSGSKEGASIDISRLDLRIGRILTAKKHPDADSLYVEEVDVGEEKLRCVVSGLVKHVPLEQMQNRMAVLLCNLKPAKMRGVTSEAMVMCASTPEKVEILVPPSGSQPGDQVLVEGYPRNPDGVLNPKHKVFETVAPDLKTDASCVATYKGIALTVSGKGVITAPTLTGAPIK